MLVSRKERPTGGGEILCFIYLFVIMQTCMLQKMCNSAPWVHTFRWVAGFGLTPEMFHLNSETIAAFPLQGAERIGSQRCGREGAV
jgi:hypothetical protein